MNWHPQSAAEYDVAFPHPNGQRLQVTVWATATSDVPCPTCKAEKGERCKWEEWRDVLPSKVHRRRLQVTTDLVS
jgi:hypothetical protein